MILTNALAYLDAVLITTVKRSMVEASQRNVTKLFFFVTDAAAKKARVLLLGKSFWLGIHVREGQGLR
jgi:hypothetical protein